MVHLPRCGRWRHDDEPHDLPLAKELARSPSLDSGIQTSSDTTRTSVVEQPPTTSLDHVLTTVVRDLCCSPLAFVHDSEHAQQPTTTPSLEVHYNGHTNVIVAEDDGARSLVSLVDTPSSSPQRRRKPLWRRLFRRHTKSDPRRHAPIERYVKDDCEVHQTEGDVNVHTIRMHRIPTEHIVLK